MAVGATRKTNLPLLSLFSSKEIGLNEGLVAGSRAAKLQFMANNNDLQLVELAQVALTVSALDRSVEFYRDVLGLPLLFTAPPGLAFFQCGAVRIMLGAAAQSGIEEKLSSALYFRVRDINRSAEVLAKRGVSFEREVHLVAICIWPSSATRITIFSR
jgi:methylmalonyl-CoA/ethylmalonyl-CoA epimerase